MKFIRGSFYQIVLLGLTLLILYLAYGKLLLSPNQYMIGTGGDALKNYYTLAYYLKYDDGVKVSGLNYPYGEHATYTDNQPIIAFTAKVLNKFLPIEDYGVGIVNSLLFIGMGLCVWFLYLILRRFKVGEWYAIAAALLITFLSPQIARIFGHYALAYMCYIPILWYLLLRYEDSRRAWFWGLDIMLLISIFGLIHPYYLLIGSVFVGAYMLVVWLPNIMNRKIYRKVLNLLIVAVVPLLIVQGFINATDTVTDRINSPYGFFLYCTQFEGVFLPGFGPMLDLWNAFTKVTKVEFEGRAYVGFIGFFVLIFTVIRLIRTLLKGRFKRALRLTRSASMNRSLWTATLVLLFAMAIPFKWNLEWVLEYISPLKQFRSLGRFAWVFYYVFSVYTAYYLYLVIRTLFQKRAKGIAISLASVIFFIWGLEAFINTNNQRKHIFNVSLFKKNAETYKEALYEASVLPEHFQAILPMPYCAIGSEKIDIYNHPYSFQKSLVASYTMGLPIIANHLSRTSLSQTMRSIQLLSSDYVRKDIIKDLPSKKPLLILTLKDADLKDYEKAILAKADTLVQKDAFTFYSLPLEALKTNQDSLHKQFVGTKDSLYQGMGYFSTSTTKNVHIKRFDKTPTTIKFKGAGAASIDKGDLVLHDGKLLVEQQHKYMEASVWIYAHPEQAGFPTLEYEQFAPNGNRVYYQHYNPKFNVEVCGDWAKATIYFSSFDERHRHKIYVRGERVFVDDFLIRPRDIDIQYGLETDGSFMFNNYPIQKD